MKKFWVLFVQYTEGGRYCRHTSLESAEKEAERLARLPENQGKEVYLYECIGKCVVQDTPVVWDIVKN